MHRWSSRVRALALLAALSIVFAPSMQQPGGADVPLEAFSAEAFGGARLLAPTLKEAVTTKPAQAIGERHSRRPNHLPLPAEQPAMLIWMVAGVLLATLVAHRANESATNPKRPLLPRAPPEPLVF
jgi:hypothetical protein